MHKILAYLSHELHRLYADSSLACGYSHYTDEPRAIEKPAGRFLLEEHQRADANLCRMRLWCAEQWTEQQLMYGKVQFKHGVPFEFTSVFEL